MGLKTLLGRKGSEARIKRRVLNSPRRQNQPDYDDKLEAYIDYYQSRAYRLGKRIVDNAESRKAEGKQIAKSWVKQGIGITARTILGPRKTHSTSSPQKLQIQKPKIAKPKLKIKRK